jgi:exonuclease SbcC
VIERLELIDFESHKNTVVDFSQGLNIITGNSDAGKSSLLRALRLVLNNEPGGEDFINFNADVCTVKLHMDGHEIVRRKGRSNKVNEYILDGKVLKAFGQGVPDEVRAVTGLTEVNAEWQFDRRPFLLAETGGYVASKLNEIVNLELIDSSLKNIGSTRRDNNQKLESVTAQHESIKPKIETYKWIAEAKRKLERIKKNQAKLDSSMMLLTRQNQLVSLHKTLQENLHAVKVIELHQLESVREILATIDMKSRQKERMVALACSIRSIELPEGILESEKLSFLSDSIQRMIDADKRIGAMVALKKTIYDLRNQIEIVLGERILNDRRLNRTVDKFSELDAMQKKLSDMRNLAYTASRLKSDVVLAEKELQTIQSQYQQIAPDVCPLCGGAFHKELA